MFDHIDDNRLNNNISNLRWCTLRENCMNSSINFIETVEGLDDDWKDGVAVVETDDGIFDGSLDGFKDGSRDGTGVGGIQGS